MMLVIGGGGIDKGGVLGVYLVLLEVFGGE